MAFISPISFDVIDVNKIQNDFEVMFKDVLSDEIHRIIRQENDELNKTRSLIKIVITGGSAFNYYFKTEYSPEFKTHDFDLKVLYDKTLPEKEHPDYNTAIDGLKQYKDHLSEIFVSSLNSRINNPEVIPLFIEFIKMINNKINFDFLNTSGKIYIPGEGDLFYTVPVAKEDVKPVLFNYIMRGKSYTNSIVDIIEYGRKFPHYGNPLSISDLSSDNRRLFFNTVPGFEAGFKNIITSEFNNIVTDTTENGNLYYISLGYLLWDTIYMLRWSSIHSPKFDRYLKKYMSMIASLNKPDLGLNCTSSPFRLFRALCLMEDPIIVHTSKDDSKEDK